MEYSILKVSGTDAESFLQAKASNDLSKLKAGEGCFAAFLLAKGEISTLSYIIKNSAEDLVLIVAADKLKHCKEHLEKFVIIEEVNFEVSKPNGSETIDLDGLAKQYPNCFAGEMQANFELEKFAEGDNLIKLDLIDKYVSFDKGCFPGQEVLSKFKNLGMKKRQERARKYTDEALQIFASAPHEKDDASKAKHDEACKEAVSLLEKAIQEDPKNQDAFETLGVILARQEKYNEAIEIMKKLVAINPDSIMAQTNLSIFYMKIGDKEKAEEHKAQSTVLQFNEALKK